MRAAGLLLASALLTGFAPSAETSFLPIPVALCASGMNGGAPYYAIDLVPTGRVPGTRTASGEVAVSFTSSPFGVAVAQDGQYAYELAVRFDRLRPATGAYVVWVATPSLDTVVQLGALDDEGVLAGAVAWNKFLVIVTMESSLDRGASGWQGPIVFRGMSRSGMMHTMAGHGPFQGEPCGKYGY